MRSVLSFDSEVNKESSSCFNPTNEIESKIVELVDHIKSNFIPKFLTISHRCASSLDKSKTFVYKDDIVNMSVDFVGTQYVGNYGFSLDGQRIIIPRKLNHEIFYTFYNLHSQSEVNILNSKIDLLIKDVREFKEFQKIKKSNDVK